MRILALEASGPVAGAALLDGERLLSEFEINNKTTHSQTLLPMMDDLKCRTGVELSSIDALALTEGPGSFTGLRIGAATAKGVGLALNIPIIPVPTVDSIAFNLFGTDTLVCPIMDARRGQVYTGLYEEKDRPVCIEPQHAAAMDDVISGLNERGREVIFAGDGVPVYKNLIREKLTVPYFFAPSHLCLQRAASTAVLAGLIYKEKGDACLVSADDFRPVYLRKSQAERQKDEAEREGKMDALAAGRLIREERQEGLAHHD